MFHTRLVVPSPDAFLYGIGAQTDHRFPYVVGHRYEFQAVPAQGVQLAIHGVDAHGTADSGGPQKSATSVGLDVVFSVMSAYSEEAKLCKTDALRLSLPAFQAPTSLPPKTTTPTETAGDTSIASSAALDNTTTLRCPSQDPCRPDSQSPSLSRVSAALAGPCIIRPPSSAEPTGSATQLSSMTPTPVGSETALASRSPARILPNKTTAGAGSGIAEEAAQGRPPRKALPPDDKHGGYCSTRIAAAGQSRFGVVGADNEHRIKQELDTTTRRRDSRYHRPLVAAESGRNAAGANGNVEEVAQRTVGSERYQNVKVSSNAAGRCAPQSSTQIASPPVDFRRQDKAVPETTGDHSSARLRWNPAWERQPPSPTAPVPSQSSLPYIGQQTGARPAFGGHDSGDNRTPRDVIARDRFRDRSPPYDPEPAHRKRHTAGAEIGEATPRYRRPRPTHEAHHDTTAAATVAAAAPHGDHSHRDEEQNPTLPPHRRHFDGDERRAMLSPSPQDSSSGREDSRRDVTPERRSNHRLRQHSAEGSRNFEPDWGPSGMRGPVRGYDRRASEGENPRADRRGWREDETSSLTTTGNTHELRKNAPRDFVAVDRSQRTRRRSLEKDPRPNEYQAHDDRRAPAFSYENSLRGDARLPPGASRWERGAPRDLWRAARSTKSRGEHAIGYTEAVFEGGGRGYPHRTRRAPDDPRVERGGDEARYGREPVSLTREVN